MTIRLKYLSVAILAAILSPALPILFVPFRDTDSDTVISRVNSYYHTPDNWLFLFLGAAVIYVITNGSKKHKLLSFCAAWILIILIIGLHYPALT